MITDYNMRYKEAILLARKLGHHENRFRYWHYHRIPIKDSMINFINSGIHGLCIGDALRVPVEFESRQDLKEVPVTEMRGGGTHQQTAGTWSDDTSLTLCLRDSLTNGLNYDDIMLKFAAWLTDGKYTSHGDVFDVGVTTEKAIRRFLSGTAPMECGGTSEDENGNGSLMRILPLVAYLRSVFGDRFIERDDAHKVIRDVSTLTHAHPRSIIACGLYLSVLSEIISNPVQKSICTGLKKAYWYYRKHEPYCQELIHFSRLSHSDFRSLSEDAIHSSGYVVDTLEAAIWCVLNTVSYRDCVLRAVNLGGDTDTIAAVAGGIAGCYMA